MKYTTVLSSTQFSDKAAVLAALDAYADSIGSQERIVGYISTTNSLLLGLSNTSHYFDFYVNSANYRLLVVRPAGGRNIFQLYKQAGTWSETWTKLVNSNETPFVSSYTATTDTIDDIYTTGIYFIGNSVGGKPLGTTGTGTNGVLIVGGYNTKDANIAKLYIYLSQTTGKKGVFVKTFAGTEGYGWTNIPTA